MKDTLIAIGATLQPHGLKGELKVYVEDAYEEDFLQSETVFIGIAGKKIPYFVESIRGGNALIVKFEDVNSIEAAQKIAKKTLEMRQQDMIPDDEREQPLEADYKHLDGYILWDSTLGEIGVIREIIDMPHQEMAVVSFNSAERLIPLNEQLIVSIDEHKKILKMNLPEGILEI